MINLLKKMQRPFANRAMYFLMAVMALCQVSMGAFKTDDDDLSPENVSPILQAMLKDYDARLPPSQDGSPIDVGVAIIIMDMVPVKRLDLVSAALKKRLFIQFIYFQPFHSTTLQTLFKRLNDQLALIFRHLDVSQESSQLKISTRNIKYIPHCTCTAFSK